MKAIFTAGFIASITVYISETCSDRNRAFLVSFPYVFQSIGILFGNLLQFLFPWKIAALLASLFSFVTLCETAFIPETKYWFMLKCKRREAAQSSAWFKSESTVDEIQDELNKIERSVLKGMIKLEPVNMFDEPYVRKPFLVSVALLIGRIGSGYLIFTHYSASFLSAVHIPYDPAVLTLTMTVVNVIAGILYCMIANKITRKNTLYISSAIMVPCMAIVSVSGFLQGSLSSQVLVSCIIVYFLIASSAHFNVIYVILSEIFPSYVRGPMFSLCFAIQQILLPVYVYLYPVVEERLGIEYVCWFFIANIALVVLTVMFFLPETRNVPLYETEDLFEESRLIADRQDRQQLLETNSIFEI